MRETGTVNEKEMDEIREIEAIELRTTKPVEWRGLAARQAIETNLELLTMPMIERID